MTTGLTLFVVVLAGYLVGLLYDGWRWLTGRRTLTQFVIASPYRVAWAVLVTSPLLVAFVGLLLHFLA